MGLHLTHTLAHWVLTSVTAEKWEYGVNERWRLETSDKFELLMDFFLCIGCSGVIEVGLVISQWSTCTLCLWMLLLTLTQTSPWDMVTCTDFCTLLMCISPEVFPEIAVIFLALVAGFAQCSSFCNRSVKSSFHVCTLVLSGRYCFTGESLDSSWGCVWGDGVCPVMTPTRFMRIFFKKIEKSLLFSPCKITHRNLPRPVSNVWRFLSWLWYDWHAALTDGSMLHKVCWNLNLTLILGVR